MQERSERARWGEREGERGQGERGWCGGAERGGYRKKDCVLMGIRLSGHAQEGREGHTHVYVCVAVGVCLCMRPRVRVCV